MNVEGRLKPAPASEREAHVGAAELADTPGSLENSPEARSPEPAWKCGGSAWSGPEGWWVEPRERRAGRATRRQRPWPGGRALRGGVGRCPGSSHLNQRSGHLGTAHASARNRLNPWDFTDTPAPMASVSAAGPTAHDLRRFRPNSSLAADRQPCSARSDAESCA